MKNLNNYGVKELTAEESIKMSGGLFGIKIVISGVLDGIKGNTKVTIGIGKV